MDVDLDVVIICCGIDGVFCMIDVCLMFVDGIVVVWVGLEEFVFDVGIFWVLNEMLFEFMVWIIGGCVGVVFDVCMLFVFYEVVCFGGYDVDEQD